MFQFQRGGESKITVNSKNVAYQKGFSYEIAADYGTGAITLSKSNNTSDSLTMSDTTESFAVGGPIVLFAGNENGWAADHERGEAGMNSYFCNNDGVKLYYFRVRKSDGTLRCNFIPARIANTGVVGLFDTVSGKFVTRGLKCNGTIAAGDDVYEVERVSGGELHVNVASGTVNNNSLMIGGGTRLVKEGTGTLTSTTVYSSRPCAYFGGTEVKGGTLTAGASGTNQVFGIDGGEVTVSSGGTLDVGASTGYFQNYYFTLNGGIIKSNSGYTNIRKHIKHLKLDADSTVNSSHIVGVWDANSDGSEYYDTYLDLGSNTLVVTGDNKWGDLRFGKTTATSAGAIDVRAVSQGLHFIGSDSDLSLVSVTAAANLKVDDGVAVMLGDYIVNATDNRNAHYTSGTGEVKVVGTFKPNTDYYHGCELQDGATLNLSGRSETLNLDGSLVSPKTVDAQYRVSFADGATIKIDIGSRTVNSRTPLVTWTTAPENIATLSFVPAADAARGFTVKSDGIYPAPNGMIIFFR